MAVKLSEIVSTSLRNQSRNLANNLFKNNSFLKSIADSISNYPLPSQEEQTLINCITDLESALAVGQALKKNTDKDYVRIVLTENLFHKIWDQYHLGFHTNPSVGTFLIAPGVQLIRG